MNSAGDHPTMGVAMHAWMLRRVLAVCDITGVAFAWVMVLAGLWMGDPEHSRVHLLGAWLAVAVSVTALVLSREQLYLSRVLTIRAVEVQRVGRSCLIAAGLLGAIDWLVGAPVGPLFVALGSLMSYGLLLVSRGAVAAWLHEHRQRDTRGRSLLVVGEADDAQPILRLLRDRPELGYRIVGYVTAHRSPADLGVPWLGTPNDLALLTQLTAATGVLVVAGALEQRTLAALVSELRALDVHVHVAVDDGEHEPNIRILPLVHRVTAPAGEPALSRAQRLVKRTFDVVAGAALMVVVAPVLLVAASLLKVAAGGPVLIRDVRVGPNGERLTVTRLRTSHLPPRRLARMIGRFCRRLCIDELPQLGNVLTGSMSLVGPRPQRPDRVPRAAADVPPGMHAGLIGLRHVEARDYPEHARYRRVDQFYAENWSLSLDVSILAASATHVLWRNACDVIRGDEQVAVGMK